MSIGQSGYTPNLFTGSTPFSGETLDLGWSGDGSDLGMVEQSIAMDEVEVSDPIDSVEIQSEVMNGWTSREDVFIPSLELQEEALGASYDGWLMAV